MNNRQRKKRRTKQPTIIVACKTVHRAEEYEKIRRAIEYQLEKGKVIILPPYLQLEAVIGQRGNMRVEIKRERGVQHEL